MSNCVSLRVQVASIMEVLAKTAVAEITKLLDDGSATLRLEMCRSQRENEALKRKLLQMEREFGAVRGYGEGAPDNSLNIAVAVQFCDEFREAPTPKVAEKGRSPVVERVFDERVSTGQAVNDQKNPVENRVLSDALDIKYESATLDAEQDWPESLLLSADRLEQDPGRSQSQVEQKISGANTCGTLQAAGSDGGAGPLCGEEELHMQPCPAGDPEKLLQAELKQEPEGEQGEFICTRCGKTFLDALQLKVHEEQHGSRKLFSCSECGKGFTSSRVLEKHQRIHSRKKPFDCSGYDRSFSNRHILQEHDSIRTGLKPYVCTQCGKSFRHKSSLKIHHRVHTGEKPFSCLQCGKCYKHMDSLKTHQFTHTGEKPFSCMQCGKCFSQIGNLKAHQRVHTGKKPYRCSECGRSFAHPSNLKTHQRVHTGEKPFGCTLCGRRFAHKHVLQKHMRTHTE